MVYMLKYDTVHGKFPGSVAVGDKETLLVNGNPVKVTGHKSIADIKWSTHL